MNPITSSTAHAPRRNLARGAGRIVGCLAVAALMWISASGQEAPPPQGRLLASQCSQCHGTDGFAVGGFEPISGKSAEDMYKSLLEMSRRRPENIMDLQARAYTPAQLQSIAIYLSTVTPTD